eukprot:11606228-Alexandrium_andersonii.AAC.3
MASARSISKMDFARALCLFACFADSAWAAAAFQPAQNGWPQMGGNISSSFLRLPRGLPPPDPLVAPLRGGPPPIGASGAPEAPIGGGPGGWQPPRGAADGSGWR